MFPPVPPSVPEPASSPELAPSSSESVTPPAAPAPTKETVLEKVAELAHKADGITFLTPVVNELRELIEGVL